MSDCEVCGHVGSVRPATMSVPCSEGCEHALCDVHGEAMRGDSPTLNAALVKVATGIVRDALANDDLALDAALGLGIEPVANPILAVVFAADGAVFMQPVQDSEGNALTPGQAVQLLTDLAAAITDRFDTDN